MVLASVLRDRLLLRNRGIRGGMAVMTATATRETVEAAFATVNTKNVYQRKAAVMAKCKAITLDKTHPHHGFQYTSIGNLENHLREWMVEEGLDITPTCDPERPGFIDFPLVNVDKPDEVIHSWWPIVEDDKGWAYTVKYPQMRVFHIGDGEEDRETRPQHTQPAARPMGRSSVTAPAPTSGKGSKCPFCAELGWETSSGGTPSYWVAAKGPHAGELQCNGRTPDGGYANHLTQLSPDELEAPAPGDGDIPW